MAVLALACIVIWVMVAAVARAVLHVRRGGSTPIAFHDRPGSAQWWARVLASVGFLFALAAPVAELLGWRAATFLDTVELRLAGLVLFALGLGGSVTAQVAMGASWRGDVDPDAWTELVTSGPFRWVRNPILTATAVTALGIALMVPNGFALLMLAASVAAWQVQVRLVEEPYLLRVHGEAYRAYAARTGRFLPGIGRRR